METLTMSSVCAILEMSGRCLSLGIFLMFFWAVPSHGFTVVADGSSATERATDVSLRCRVHGLMPEDEVVRVTWFSIDPSQRFLSEIFSADLTNDRPAFLFSSDWSGRGLYDASTMANIRLPARFVTRDFGRNYRCLVSSLLSSGFADVRITVSFGPGSSIIISPGGRVESREGEELQLTCVAQCSPECSYRWYKTGRLVATSGILTMAPLTRDQAGLYACQARNEAGRSIKPVDLRVSFPASALSLHVNGDDLEPSRSQVKQKHGVVETGKTIIFTCKVTGWPEPNIEWSNSNVGLGIANRTRIISTAEVEMELKSSVYEIKSATCLDNGKITCKTWNNIGEPSFKSGILNMSCAPFETRHSTSCSHGQNIQIIQRLYTHLHINLCFFGNPVPLATMIHLHNNNQTLKTYSGVTSCDFETNRCTSTFTLNITSPDLYGEYIVKVSNGQGHFEKRYLVLSQQPPMPPSDISVSNISATSACFSWSSNFNGGARQVFLLQVHAANQQENHDGNRELSIEEEEANNKSRYSVCVPSLRPALNYDAVLSVSNIFGPTDVARSTSFTTRALFNYTVPSVPSWLTVVPATTAVGSGLPSTASPREQVGQLVFANQLTDTPQARKGSFWTFPAAGVEQGIDDNNIAEPDFDDERGINFFQLLNLNLGLNKLTSEQMFKLWLQDKHNSNDSSKLHELFVHSARSNDTGFQPASTLYPKADFDSDNATTFSSIWHLVSLTTPLAKTAKSSSSLSPVILSVICIAITCVLGVIISLVCITFLKRQQRRSQFNEKYRQRVVSRHSVKRTTAIGRPLQTQILDQQNICRLSLQRVPSITCVYNENTFFTPPATRRPRLSTPDLELSRPKEHSDKAVARQGHSLEHTEESQGCVPRITCDNTIGSCASYLELVQAETELSPQSCQSVKNLQESRGFSNYQGQYLKTACRSLSYSSLQQTFVKNLSEEEYNISSSYLDLYEAPTVRSRSRSPSNIYNPLFFEASANNSCADIREFINSDTEKTENKTAATENTTILPNGASTSTEAAKNRKQYPANKVDETHSECVQCRPKKIPLRLNLARSSEAKDTGGLAPESSYELVNVTSRKRFVSSLYLPMSPKTDPNCAFYDNSDNTDDEHADIDSSYEKPVNSSGFQTRRIPYMRRKEEEECTDDSHCSSDTFKCGDSETQPDMYSYISSQYQHYIDIDALSLRKKPREPAYVSQCDQLMPCVRRLENSGVGSCSGSLLYEAPATCLTHNGTTNVNTYQSKHYVPEERLLYVNRDSVSTMSTTETVSTYFNETDLRRSSQSSCSSDFDEPRSRKSSSDSDLGIRCSRKFSFDSDCTENCFGDLVFESWHGPCLSCRRSSEVTNDRRDSGVSVSCRHNYICCKGGAMRLHESDGRHLTGSSVFDEQVDSQQSHYEEPVIYEHIYAEVSAP